MPTEKNPDRTTASAKTPEQTKRRPTRRSDADVVAALNQVESAKELVEALGLPETQLAAAEALLAHRRTLDRLAFTDTSQLHEAVATIAGAAELVEAIKDVELTPVEPVPAERQFFNQLLLQNPNYFGNLEDSVFDPVQPIKGNTTYESLACVGLNPPFDRLEAVIHVKEPFGYGGDVCSNGSREYVRFYVDINDDGNWVDVGFAQVRVYNIPGRKPLCYAVSHVFDPELRLCFIENIVKVRAILSWNSVPPANTPGHIPVWGERTDVEVQIRPRKFIVIDDFIDLIAKDDPLVPVLKELEVDTTAGVVPTPSVTLAEKKKLYREAKVPASRYAFSEALEVASSTETTAFESPNSIALAQLGLDEAEVAEVVEALQIVPVDGDTSYEELTCVGYDPGKKLVEAVFHVKRKFGYSGSLCTDGSTEYVAFWVDVGAGFQYLGTATVNVHDLSTLPNGGVHYAADLKVDLSQHEIPCTSGARTPRLRAVLSWQTAPPPGNPYWVPTWGNAEQCRIQLSPGPAIAHVPLIESVGDIAVSDVNQVTGLATGPFVIGGGVALQSPFGGKVTVTGRIGAPPDAFGGPQQPFKYRVRVSDDGGLTWETLNNNVLVNISEWKNGVPQQCAPLEFVCPKTLTTTDDGDGLGGGWYTYLEDTITPWTRSLVQDKLAEWHTGDREGLWRIELAAKDDSGTILGYDYTNVLLDNFAPSVAPPAPDHPDAKIDLSITGYTVGGTLHAATDCDHIPVGAVIHGDYEVRDPGVTHAGQHMGAFTLTVIPAGPAGGAAVVPASKTFPVLPTAGEAGTWDLDTTGMAPCGYVVRLWARDRTVVSGSYIGRRRIKDVGFCLVG